jgi:hypothetical protein
VNSISMKAKARLLLRSRSSIQNQWLRRGCILTLSLERDLQVA